MASYTHNVVFRVGDGGKYVIAKVEFDKQKGIGLHKIVETSEPLDLDAFQDFIDFMKMCEALFMKYDGTPTIALQRETYTDPDLDIKVKNTSKLK